MEDDINKIEINDSLLSINQNDGRIDRYSNPKNLGCPMSSAIEYPNYRQVYQNNQNNCLHLNLDLRINITDSTRQFDLPNSINAVKTIWKDHWLHYYEFNKEFIIKRMHLINLFRAEAYLGKKFNHEFVISCRDCGEIIKNGTKSPSKNGAACFFLFIIIIFIIIPALIFTRDKKI